MHAAFFLLLGMRHDPAIAQTPSLDLDAALQRRLVFLADAHQGEVFLFANDLKSGRTVALNASTAVKTASVIKLAILYEAMEQVRAGHVRWTDTVELAAGDAVRGSGLLQFFDTPLHLTLKDVLTMMIVVSDNTATNLAIDKLGLASINARLEQLGLKQTHLYKKIGKPSTAPMPADQPAFGLGKSTAAEMARLMSRIGLCELDAQAGMSLEKRITSTDRSICDVAISMLRNQFYRETIPRYLETLDVTEAGVGIASKTGSLDAVRNDVAIVSGKNGPIILSIFTQNNADQKWTVDNDAEILVARLAREIVAAWSSEGLDSSTLVPGLGLRQMEGRETLQSATDASK